MREEKHQVQEKESHEAEERAAERNPETLKCYAAPVVEPYGRIEAVTGFSF